VSEFKKFWEKIEDTLDMNNVSMKRSRPYSGQPHTNTGARGAAEVRGVTFRDLRDCYIRAFMLASHHINPARYSQALKGENALLSENDLYGWDLNQIDPIAVFQNFSCEVEKLMGTYPNVPTSKPTPTSGGRK
jgi:hypothetical protein